MKLKIFIITILIAACFGGNDLAGMNWLLLPQSPEVDAMGGVSVSLPLNSIGTSSNPASARVNGDYAISFVQAFHIQDTRENYITAMYNLGKFNFGTAGYFGSVDDIEARTSPTEVPDYTFSSRQMYLGVGMSFIPTEAVSFGANAKWINEKIDMENASGTAFDLGTQISTKYFNLGVSIVNIGDNYKFMNIIYPIPMTYNIGVSGNYNFVTGELCYTKPDLRSANYNLGLLFDITDWLVLRTGARIGHDTRMFSAGATFNYAGFSLTYSFTPYKDGLGIRHSLGISRGIL